MSEELQELLEHAEHAKHNPNLAPVSLTMALPAVLVAVVTLHGHRAHPEEVVVQAKSSDQWAFYRAKNIRRHTDELFTDLTSAITTTGDPAILEKLGEEYSKEAERYKDDQKEIEDKARELEAEVGRAWNGDGPTATTWPKCSLRWDWSLPPSRCCRGGESSGAWGF